MSSSKESFPNRDQRKRSVDSLLRRHNPADSSVPRTTEVDSLIQRQKPAGFLVPLTTKVVSLLQRQKPADSLVPLTTKADSLLQPQKPADSLVSLPTKADSLLQPQKPADSLVSLPTKADSLLQPQKPDDSFVPRTTKADSLLQPQKPADSLVPRTTEVVSFTQSSRPVNSLVQRPKPVYSIIQNPRPIDSLAQRTAQLDFSAQRYSLAQRPRSVDSLNKSSKPVVSVSKPSECVDTLVHNSRQYDSIVQHTVPVDFIVKLSGPVEAIVQRPRTVDSLALWPSSVEFLAQRSRRGNSLAKRPRPVDHLAQRQRPVDSYAQRPRPVDSLTQSPRPEDFVAQRPRRVDPLTQRPRPVDSLAQRPRPVDSLAQRTRLHASLAQRTKLHATLAQRQTSPHSPTKSLQHIDNFTHRLKPSKPFTQRPTSLDSFLDSIPGNLQGIQQFDGPSNHVIYMSSVIVISKTSGRQYQVYQSPITLRRESSITEYINPLIPNINKVLQSQKSIMDVKVESSRGNRDFTSPPPTQTQFSAVKATKFQRNIRNPTMQRMVEAKLQEIKPRSRIYRQPPVQYEDYPSFDNNHGLHATRSKPTSPTLPRRNGGRTSPTPSIDSRLSDRIVHSPTKTSQRTSHSPPSSVRSSPAFVTRTPRNDTTPDFKKDSASISNESLLTDAHQNRWGGSRSGSPATQENSDRQGIPESSSQGASPRRSKKGPASLKGLLLNFKTQLASNTLEASTPRTHTRTGSNASVVSAVSKGGNELERSWKSYQGNSVSDDAVSNDIEPTREMPPEIIPDYMDHQEEYHIDSVDDPRNIFWTPALSFHAYKHGDRKVRFVSLWPKYKELREMLQNSGIQQTIRNHDAVLDICTLACTCGPVHLLQCLIDLEMIRIDQLVEGGSGLLHLALLAQNLELAQYLMASKISPKIKDITGLTADQVCFNPAIRKQMAPRYILNREVNKDKAMLKPSLQDKDSIFRLVSNPRYFPEIQKKLQTLDFNVNTECDSNGDFLLHIAVRKGLNQLPLLMALVNIQKADIELCNAEGLTPLMIASAVGNCVLCDVLICLFGADPNKRGPQSGRSALHCAAEGNHRKTVECLIRRGADINMEDHEGLRADDLTTVNSSSTDDCQEIIVFNRHKRLEMLSDLVKKGEVVSSQLLPSDLFVVDGDGNTLIMIAAAFNRFQTLHCLIEVSKSTLNAQHSKTGMTALAIASKMGNVEAVTILLRHRACPTIADMTGYFPLHHAVMNNHETVVDVFLDYFPDTYVSLYKAMRLCKRTSLHTKLKSAWERRQEEIVTPKLLGCTLNGDAEELFLLLDEGDSINPKSGTGNWPLYLAVENGHLEVLKLLFERGGDIRKRHPTTGATALHLAAKMGHQSIISYLLQYCRNSHNDLSTATLQIINPETPVKSDNYPEKRKRLLDINAVDREQKTALQLAAEMGFSRIIDLLLSYGATTALLDHAGNLVTCPHFEGVRIMIESRRQQHMHQVIKAIEDKTRKSLPMLQQIWLPKFDHNLRNKEGSTPLMIAAAAGKVQIIQFLLESAVYPEASQYESDSDGSDSDADSGVLDPPGFPKDNSKSEEEFQASVEVRSVTSAVSTDLPRESNYFIPSLRDHSEDVSDNSDFHHKRLDQIVHDSNRPKTQSIFQDGVISHVCAVNLNDGTNVLHHSILTADAPHILHMFLDADSTPLNMQDDRGETVLHMACRLRRKKSVELILARSDLDLNIRTFDGHLPEEVTSSKAIRKLVAKARASSSELPTQRPLLMHQDVSSCGSSDKTVSMSGSTVNFDKIHSRYETLKSGAQVK